ncbi:hypothetical protein ACFOWA_17555 [Pedobacter lithocola]|uniref:Lipocalin-like domain-containing protein n=1 Tax=Pedobacter lithocola TaxID=1908239 RepID=A0ABV8PF82_9SPHI
MRNLILLIALFIVSGAKNVAKGQCETTIGKPALQTNMMIWGAFETDKKSRPYVAEIINVNGNTLKCKFVHTNSIYTMQLIKKDNQGSVTSFSAKVTGTVGGKFSTGNIFTFIAYSPEPDGCDLEAKMDYTNLDAIAVFPDGKLFYGILSKKDGKYIMTFAHSGSVYTFDKSWKVTKQVGGSYKVGTLVTTVYAKGVIVK